MAALAACSTERHETGKAPEGPVRESGHSSPATADHKPPAPKRQGERPPAAKSDKAVAVVGVAATKVYHRPDCALLKDVPTSDQVRFTSQWEGLNAGYTPCKDCSPGP